MDEINACIAANAESEELVDKPETDNSIVRVAGPFTMEGVIAVEEGPDTPVGGAPEEMETFAGAATEGTRADLAVANAEAHLDKILRLLKASGVDFSANKNQKFTRLEPMTGAALLHAEGEWANGDKKERRVAVSIGPEIGNITTYQVEEAVRAANRRGYDELVFAGFGFDAAAQASIEESSHPNLRVHMALIRGGTPLGLRCLWHNRCVRARRPPAWRAWSRRSPRLPPPLQSSPSAGLLTATSNLTISFGSITVQPLAISDSLIFPARKHSRPPEGSWVPCIISHPKC
jgi:hypothetical protein